VQVVRGNVVVGLQHLAVRARTTSVHAGHHALHQVQTDPAYRQVLPVPRHRVHLRHLCDVAAEVERGFDLLDLLLDGKQWLRLQPVVFTVINLVLKFVERVRRAFGCAGTVVLVDVGEDGCRAAGGGAGLLLALWLEDRTRRASSCGYHSYQCWPSYNQCLPSVQSPPGSATLSSTTRPPYHPGSRHHGSRPSGSPLPPPLPPPHLRR